MTDEWGIIEYQGMGDTVARVSRSIDSDLSAVFEQADDASVRSPGRLHVCLGTSTSALRLVKFSVSTIFVPFSFIFRACLGSSRISG